MKKTFPIEVEFTDEVALAKLQAILDKQEKNIDRLARELCLASDDPKPNRSLSPSKRKEYRRMAEAAFSFINSL